MAFVITTSDQLNLLRQRLPIEPNNIKSIPKPDDFSLYHDEVVGLEIYVSPLLLTDKLSMIKRYIGSMRLNLIAQKLNTDTIIVTGKTGVPVL